MDEEVGRAIQAVWPENRNVEFHRFHPWVCRRYIFFPPEIAQNMKTNHPSHISAGPVIDLLMVLHIYHLAKRMDGGLKGSLRSKWIANITADFLIRFLIPELGDIIDIFLSANTRNLLLLDEHLRTEVAKRAELRRERALPESAPSSGDAVAKPTWKAQLPSLAGKKPNHQDQSVSDHHNVADNGSQHQNHHYQSRHHQQSQPQPQHSGEYPSQSRDNNVRDTMYAMVNSHAMDPQPTSGSMPKPRDPYSQPTGTGYHHGTHQHGPSPAREQRRPSHHGHHYHDHHGNPLPPRSVRDGSDASAIMYRRHKRYPIDPADPKELIDEPLSYHGFKA